MLTPCRVLARASGVAFLAFGLATTAHAQAPGRRSVPELMATVRAHVASGAAISVLGQQDSAYTRPVLDELADSLTAMAITGDSRSGASDAALHVITTLKSAAGPHARIPYDGTAERLMRIHREAQGRSIRIVAFGALLDIQDIGGVLPYVRAFVTSNQPDADRAISQIIMRADERSVLYRPEARALLRELYERGLVPHPDASSLLEGFAVEQGWVRRP